MILHALHDYYRRKVADPDPARRLPAFGLEHKPIAFVLELSRDGALIAIADTRSGDGKNRTATAFLVPKGVKKTSGIAANLLWDNAEYVLAVPDAKKLMLAQDKGKDHEYLARLREMQSAFKARIEALPPQALADEGVQAVLAFLSADPAAAVRLHSAWQDIADSNPTLGLRLAGDNDLVCQRPAVALAGSANAGASDDEGTADESGPVGICLITGVATPSMRVHDAIKGVWGAQTSGANIVSFNLDAFNSFGKSQGGNAPVGRPAAFAYTTALNHLLERGSRQRIQVGDASTVFWAEKGEDADLEDWFVNAFGDTDDPDARSEQIRALFEAVSSGRFDGALSTANRFHVLGLAPNAARIAVRFWHVAPVAEVGARIREWFEDLRIIRRPFDPEYPALGRLLQSTAVLGKAKNIAPTLAGDAMRAILGGLPLPASLLQACVQRLRADIGNEHFSHLRAALMKACLNRRIRCGQLDGKEITVALDPDNTEPAYLSGRLFAAYERVQSDAAGRDLNRSVRDTYFGAAMSNPATVLPRLIQLNQHHMRDLRRTSPGLHVLRDRLIGEIWGQLSADRALPHNLPLAERARFALGYYHQRQAFFAKAISLPAALSQADLTTTGAS